MTRNDEVILSAMLSLAAMRLRGATRVDLISLNGRFADLIPDQIAVHAASVWAEQIVAENELRAGVNIYNEPDDGV